MPCFSLPMQPLCSCYIFNNTSRCRHSFCLSQVLESNIDFLQPYTGLHRLSLNVKNNGEAGHDFQVAGSDRNYVLS